MEKKNTNKKALKFGSISIALTAVVIAIVVVFNLLIAELPSKWVKIDTSKNGLVSFSEATKNYLEGVNDEVEIYLVAETGKEDGMIKQLLEYYASEKSNIKVKYVDPVKEPTFVSDYTDEEISENSLIVKSDKRHKVVDGSEFFIYEIIGAEGYYMSQTEYEYWYEYYYSYGQPLSANEYFEGEMLVTSAIDYVVTDKLPMLYCTTGHGEVAMGKTYQAYLESINVNIESVNLIAGESVAVPEDAAMVYINAPEADITEKELEALETYVDNGGKIILTTNYELFTAEEMPNLAKLTAHMGMKAVEGLVSETDVKHYSMDTYTILPEIDASSYMAPYSGGNFNFMVLYSHGIESTGSDTASTNPIFTTTENAHLKDSEEKKTFNLAMQSTNEKGGAIYWFASAYMFDDMILSYSKNLYSFAELVSSSCSVSAPVEIALKSVSQGTALTVSEADEVLWSAVFVIVIPVGCLIAGFAVWFRRRRR